MKNNLAYWGCCCLSLGLALALFGCDEDATADGGAGGEVAMGGAAAGDCTPSAETWDDAKPTLETYCGLCHGETPAFGAPYTLLDYDALMTGEEGARPVDRVVVRMRAGEMPPVGQTQVPTEAYMTLLDWATCGENSGTPDPGPNPGGFDVTRPVFTPPADPPEGAGVIEFRADMGHIPADVPDQYTCFSFSGPPGGDRYIRRFEPVIDDTRVIHHIVLYQVPEGAGDGTEEPCGANLDAAFYVWAPGQKPVQFVSGGLITDQSRRYRLEVHYNNAAGHADVADQSGVRLYHTAPEGLAIDMLTIGPDGFRLPAMERTAVTGGCTITEPLTVIATMPHMHEIGSSLTSTVVRADGTEEDLISLRGWDFNSQLYYDAEGFQLAPGDAVRTECVFENTSTNRRQFGPYTDDEMCYNFLFVTPPPTSRRCNANDDTGRYMPGLCAPEGAARVARAVLGSSREGQPPAAMGGDLPTGLWRLSGFEMTLESADLGPVVLDLEASTVEAWGALWIGEDGRFDVDVQGAYNARFIGGGEAVRPITVSLGGVVSNTDPVAGTMPLQGDCPEAFESVIHYTYADGQVTFFLGFEDMVRGVSMPSFELVE